MTPEFSRPFLIASLPPGGCSVAIEADAGERAALARRMGVPEIAALACTFRLIPESVAAQGSIIAQARLVARLTQICVVALEPFETELDEVFQVRFVPAGCESEDDDPFGIDEISWHGPALDLGEAAAEQLGLALDPYPRGPDAPGLGAESETAPEDAPGRESGRAAHPFAALAALRRGS